MNQASKDKEKRGNIAKVNIARMNVYIIQIWKQGEISLKIDASSVLKKNIQQTIVKHLGNHAWTVERRENIGVSAQRTFG